MVVDHRLLRDGGEGIRLGRTGDGLAHDQIFLGQTPVLIGLADDPRRPAAVIALVAVTAVVATLVQYQSVGMKALPLLPGGLYCGDNLEVSSATALKSLARELAPQGGQVGQPARGGNRRPQWLLGQAGSLRSGGCW